MVMEGEDCIQLITLLQLCGNSDNLNTNKSIGNIVRSHQFINQCIHLAFPIVAGIFCGIVKIIVLN